MRKKIRINQKKMKRYVSKNPSKRYGKLSNKLFKKAIDYYIANQHKLGKGVEAIRTYGELKEFLGYNPFKIGSALTENPTRYVANQTSSNLRYRGAPNKTFWYVETAFVPNQLPNQGVEPNDSDLISDLVWVSYNEDTNNTNNPNVTRRLTNGTGAGVGSSLDQFENNASEIVNGRDSMLLFVKDGSLAIQTTVGFVGTTEYSQDLKCDVAGIDNEFTALFLTEQAGIELDRNVYLEFTNIEDLIIHYNANTGDSISLQNPNTNEYVDAITYSGGAEDLIYTSIFTSSFFKIGNSGSATTGITVGRPDVGGASGKGMYPKGAYIGYGNELPNEVTRSHLFRVIESTGRVSIKNISTGLYLGENLTQDNAEEFFWDITFQEPIIQVTDQNHLTALAGFDTSITSTIIKEVLTGLNLTTPPFGTDIVYWDAVATVAGNAIISQAQTGVFHIETFNSAGSKWRVDPINPLPKAVYRNGGGNRDFNIFYNAFTNKFMIKSIGSDEFIQLVTPLQGADVFCDQPDAQIAWEFDFIVNVNEDDMN